MIQGVLLDVDGVIVDSEGVITVAITRMFAELGLAVDPGDFPPYVGRGEDECLAGIAAKYDLALDAPKAKARTFEIYAGMSLELHPLPGVREFIRRCRQRGLKLAAATSADEIKLRINLRAAGLSRQTFDGIVTGQDVAKRKPDPEIFLAAARHLGLAAGNCLVVEDAVSGLAAASAAGARCLALTTSFSAAELALADWIAPTLAAAPEACLDW